MENQDEKWGLFWCHILHPIIFEEIDREDAHSYLRSLSTQEVVFPDGKTKKPSLSTLKRKLKQYRENGFLGFERKPRNDRGKPRASRQDILERAIELKKEQPRRSDVAINFFLEETYGKKIARSTLYRHLKDAGATKIKLGIDKKKVRKRWTRDHTNDLWIGDFSQGPYVIVNGKTEPTYLSLFIDCHSRYVVEGKYYLSSKVDILIDSLLRAWSSHGKSSEIYLDNGRVYHCNALKAACYDLSIRLIHSTPGDPSPRGLVERIFSTNQTQFEAEVRAGDILTIDQLNKSFFAYLDVCYHEHVHSETGETPRVRYEKGLTVIRHVDMDRAVEFFMEREQRRVHPDFSDVQVNANFFRVDPKLRGDMVEVRWDPYSSMDKVILYSLKGQYLGVGSFYLRDRGAQISPAAQGKADHNFLQLLVNRHEKRLQKLQSGIDYRKALAGRDWAFSAFLGTVAFLMGRKGGISAFTCDEQEVLRNIYNRHPFLNESMLREAFAKAAEKNIVHLAYQLDQMESSPRK